MTNKRTLVVGASEDTSRYSNFATTLLRNYGHDVVAFGKTPGKINETPITDVFPENGPFDTVTLYLNPNNQTGYTQSILNLHPKRVIFNPGTENKPFEEQLKSAGIEVVEACTLVMLRTNQF